MGIFSVTGSFIDNLVNRLILDSYGVLGSLVDRDSR